MGHRHVDHEVATRGGWVENCSDLTRTIFTSGNARHVSITIVAYDCYGTYPLKLVMFAKKVPFERIVTGVDSDNCLAMSTFPHGVLVEGRCTSPLVAVPSTPNAGVMMACACILGSKATSTGNNTQIIREKVAILEQRIQMKECGEVRAGLLQSQAVGKCARLSSHPHVRSSIYSCIQR